MHDLYSPLLALAMAETGAAAIAFHSALSHSKASEVPMNAMQFVVAHPAVLVVAIAVFVVFGITYRPV